jgi:putative ABC transport system permease protein
MADRRWTKVARDLWLHKARTMLVVAAIVIGIVGAGAVLNTWALLRVVTREGFLATNPASATLRVDSVSDAMLARVRALPSVQAASSRRTVIASVLTSGGWNTAMLFSGPELATSDIGKVVKVDGAWPARDGMLVVENSSVEFGGIAMGDSLALRLADGPVFKVLANGIARDAGLAPGWMEHVVYAFVTPATLRAIGAPSVPNELRILVSGNRFDRAATRRTALEVKAVVENLGQHVESVDIPVPGRHIHAAQMDSLLLIQGAFGVLSLVLSALLVVNLVSAMLTGQTREIGVMKAIGAKPIQIATMYLVLALVLGIAASAVAIPIGAFIGGQYAAFSASILNFDVAGTSIPLWSFAVQLAVGATLPVVAAFVPVWRGCRIGVNEALRDAGMHAAAPNRTSPPLRVSGLTRPLLLSIRNAFRRRQRMVLTLLALSTSGAVFLAALNLRASIQRSVGVLYEDVMRFDVAYRLEESHSADSLEAALRDVQGVAGVEAWNGVRAAVSRSDGMLAASFQITGLSPDTKLVSYPVAQGTWLGEDSIATEEENHLVVSERLLADEPSLTVGSVVALVVNGQETVWRVIGVVESGVGSGAFATRETVGRVAKNAGARAVVVSLTGRSIGAQAEANERIRGRLEEGGFQVANAQLMSAGRAALEDHMLMVVGFLLVMSQLTVAVGGLGLASTMSLAVLERTREIGVLRAIGASHRAILSMIQIEGLVIALASWALALPLSVPLSALLGRRFGEVMMPVPVRYVPEPSAMLVWLFVVVTVSLVASAWPARRAMRVTTAAALAYE